MLDAANKLEAQERLRMIADYRVGSGIVKPWDQRRHTDYLRRVARSDSKPATTADLAAFGIQVVRRKKK